MPTIEANLPSTAAGHCPLCDAPLDPEHPEACTKCDWVAPERAGQQAGGSIRDKIAVCLSIVPGLGHIYKGYKTTGVLYFIGSIFAFAFAFLAGTASAGWGLLLMPLYWLGIMMQVYWLEDKGLKPHPHPTAA